MNNIDWLESYNDSLFQIEKEYSLTDLHTEDEKFAENSYWNRIGNLSIFSKNMEENGYHFLYEIQGLSSQIHFGLKNCLFFDSLRSKRIGFPNLYNHRYGFFVESTVHAIYAYWNRVAGFINFYFEKPFGKRQIYFNQRLLEKLELEFKGIEKSSPFKYVLDINSTLNSLDRNELAHNNSLIMQEFLPYKYDESRLNFDEINKKLVFLNNTIAREIDVLCELFEYLEKEKNRK
ncbi:hypothetical protein [Sphingobacterium composti Ten et al. 2007 non Yoo et al. 2007]|uniref:hypothetical protein n=1 Tax=Sphingobacterium composti TaxID=363260 RepID=UPI001358AE93|nr:hypothetical protein [Sphingobacterium composti Ten et al. 2007 non Yoo et al. 2007]